MKKLVLILSLISLALTTEAQDGIKFDETSSWQQLLAESGRQNKPIFLDCYTSWCGPCKGMAADVFTQKNVGDFMNENFICTKRDMEKGEGIELRTKYKSMIPGFPTFLLINSKGEVIHQAAGYMNPNKFIASMQAGLELKSWLYLKKRYESGDKDWEKVWEYVTALKSAFQKDLTTEVWNEMSPKLTMQVMQEHKGAYELFKDQWKDAETPLFREFMSSSSSVYRKHKDSEDVISVWAGRLYSNAVRAYSNSLTNNDSTSKTDTYNYDKAEILLNDMREFHFKNRERYIAVMMINQAVTKQDWMTMFELIESATSFGLMRYDTANIMDWARMCALAVTDKKTLEKCLKYTDLKDMKEKLISPNDYDNRATVLEKVGRTKEAQELRNKSKTKKDETLKAFNLI